MDEETKKYFVKYAGYFKEIFDRLRALEAKGSAAPAPQKPAAPVVPADTIAGDPDDADDPPAPLAGVRVNVDRLNPAPEVRE